MTPTARIQATFELLEEIASTPRPADALVGAYFRARRFIGSKDRNALSTRVYAVLRHKARLGWWLARVEGGDSARAMLLVWLMLGERLSLATLEELFSGGKFAPTSLTDSERGFLRKLEGSTIEHPEMPEAVRVECPPAYAAALKEKFGKNFERELRAMLEPAPLDLRVNLIKATREAVFATLQRHGLKVKNCELSPWGIRVFERPSLGDMPLLKEGAVDIQDEGSQLIAQILEAKPGERIVDFCAGAGGKTLAIAAMMENKGRIIACDVVEKRLKSALERFRRAGLHNIEIRTLTNERDPWVKKHKGGFDRVLVDAPCSGSGTWRRNPDSRWNNLGPSLEDLLKLQAEILDSAARLVKEGGRLVYATCSLFPQENENQIEKFLAAHPDFTQGACGLKGADYLSLTPAQHDTDGFFAAAMVRGKQQ